jgi:hypothetical protein
MKQIWSTNTYIAVGTFDWFYTYATVPGSVSNKLKTIKKIQVEPAYVRSNVTNSSRRKIQVPFATHEVDKDKNHVTHND